MAFNKISMVFLVLLFVAITANARLFESEAREKPQFCTSCECTEEYGEIKCHRRDQKIGGCPKTCGEPCGCNKMDPPTCWCTYEVDTCSASACSAATATKLVNVLGLINGNL